LPALKRLIAAVDRWQRGNRIAGPTYGVIKKFSDDNASMLTVVLGWYGFTAIYPLLLVVITTFGFIGQAVKPHQTMQALLAKLQLGAQRLQARLFPQTIARLLENPRGAGEAPGGDFGAG